MRKMAIGAICGFAAVFSGVFPFVPMEAPVKAAPAVAVQAVADPANPIRWTLTAPAGQTYTTAEINASRMTVFLGAQATAVIAHPTGSATPISPSTAFSCAQVGTTQAWNCLTTQNAGQVIGTTAAGTYNIALGMEFRQLTGAYASRVVSAICTFQFPIIDNRPSIQPTNVRVAAS